MLVAKWGTLKEQRKKETKNKNQKTKQEDYQSSWQFLYSMENNYFCYLGGCMDLFQSSHMKHFQ